MSLLLGEGTGPDVTERPEFVEELQPAIDQWHRFPNSIRWTSVVVHSSPVRSVSAPTTVRPLEASVATVARPAPEAAPVTTATASVSNYKSPTRRKASGAVRAIAGPTILSSSARGQFGETQRLFTPE